jgi:death on curing protein
MKLPLEFVLELHADQIATFGGLPGIRDLAGLTGSLEQPWLEVFGRALHPSLELQAAAILFHLSRNHPLLDGNKRIAWACMETFLLLEGFTLEIADDEAYDLVNRVAQGDVEKAKLAASLRDGMKEVLGR